MSGQLASARRTLPALGVLDASSAATLRTQAGALPASEAIVVDLRATEGIDAPGLGALVWLVGRQRASGGQVAFLVPPGGPVRRLVALAGLDRLATVLAEGR